LSFTTAACCVVRSVCDVIGVCVCTIAAGVCAELSGHGHSGTEEEERIQDVEGEWEDGMEGKVIIPGDREEVDE